MNYPESISPYLYKGGFDKICEHELNWKEVGAFAFYAVGQPGNTKQRNDRAFNKVMSETRGDIYRAQKYIDRAHVVDLLWY